MSQLGRNSTPLLIWPQLGSGTFHPSLFGSEPHSHFNLIRRYFSMCCSFACEPILLQIAVEAFLGQKIGNVQRQTDRVPKVSARSIVPDKPYNIIWQLTRQNVRPSVSDGDSNPRIIRFYATPIASIQLNISIVPL